MANSSPSFPGFEIPQQNWFKMPNNWTDITAEMSSIAELKVVEYVLRHTWGYQEYGVKRAITIDEFQHGRKCKDGSRMDKGTGLSKQSVITGVKAAVKRGLLEEEIDDRDKARVKKYYLLRMRRDRASGGGVKKLDADVKNFDTGVKDLDSEGQKSGQRTEKETLERKQQQESVRKYDITSGHNSRGIAAALIEQGITKRVAHQLVTQYSCQRIKNNLNWFAWKRKTHPGAIKTNPAGLLRRAIEQDYASEGQHQGFQTRQQKAAASAKQKERLQAQERLIEERRQQQAATLQQKEKARAKRLERLREQYHSTTKEHTLWDKTLKRLKKKLSAVAFNTYLAQTELLSVRDDTAIIAVPNQIIKSRVEGQLADPVRQALAQHFKHQVKRIQCEPLDARKDE